MSLFRVAVEPMPDNPTRKTIDDRSGLWRVVVYKRRGEHSEEEDLIQTPGENLTRDNADKLSQVLNRIWGSR
jgi:hypothetical protein